MSAPAAARAPSPGLAAFANTRLLLIFLALFALVVIGGAVLIAVIAPRAQAPECEVGVPCGSPPTGPPLVNQAMFHSSAFGYSVEYNDEVWKPSARDDTRLVLALAGEGVSATLLVTGARGASPQSLVDDRLAQLRKDVPALAADTSAEAVVLGPNIGYVNAAGGAYAGTADSPQGPAAPLSVAVMAASHGDVGILVTLGIVGGGPDDQAAIREAADSVLNTVRWPR